MAHRACFSGVVQRCRLVIQCSATWRFYPSLPGPGFLDCLASGAALPWRDSAVLISWQSVSGEPDVPLTYLRPPSLRSICKWRRGRVFGPRFNWVEVDTGVATWREWSGFRPLLSPAHWFNDPDDFSRRRQGLSAKGRTIGLPHARRLCRGRKRERAKHQLSARRLWARRSSKSRG